MRTAVVGLVLLLGPVHAADEAWEAVERELAAGADRARAHWDEFLDALRDGATDGILLMRRDEAGGRLLAVGQIRLEEEDGVEVLRGSRGPYGNSGEWAGGTGAPEGLVDWWIEKGGTEIGRYGERGVDAFVALERVEEDIQRFYQTQWDNERLRRAPLLVTRVEVSRERSEQPVRSVFRDLMAAHGIPYVFDVQPALADPEFPSVEAVEGGPRWSLVGLMEHVAMRLDVSFAITDWERVEYRRERGDPEPVVTPDAARRHFAAIEDEELRRRSLAALADVEAEISRAEDRRRWLRRLRGVALLYLNEVDEELTIEEHAAGEALREVCERFDIGYRLRLPASLRERRIRGTFGPGTVARVLEAMAAEIDAEIEYGIGTIGVRPRPDAE